MAFEYEIKDHGCDHAQYFQGAGVAFTKFTQIATGSGSSAREAGEDALEQFYMSADRDVLTVENVTALESEIKALSEEEDAHDGCRKMFAADYPETPEDGSDFERWHETCEIAHRVSIRWRY